MVSDNGARATNDSSLQIVDISSDSEDDIHFQPYYSKSGSACQDGSTHHESGSFWKNDIIELTDSDSGDSLDLPDTLSSLIRDPQRKVFAGSKQQPHFKKSIPLYADTSEDETSNQDCVLILNDPPDSRKLVRSVHSPKGAPKNNPSLDRQKKSVVPDFAQATGKLHTKRAGRSLLKMEEQVRRQKYAADLFARLNKDIFSDRLPKNTTLEWNKRLLTTAGRARWHRSNEGVHTTKIELASKILDCDERIGNTLAHEMCHLACWVIDNQPQEGHGQLFKSWVNKVMHEYPEIHISTRHNYEISYPYEWECEKCSKIYGRYSKSIRPDECVCGVCKAGKLIPLFAERRRMVPKVGRMAMARPQDSPCSIVERSTRNDSIALRTSPPSADIADKDILDLVNTFEDVSIDNMRN